MNSDLKLVSAASHQIAIRHDWLDLTKEEVLEPDLPIIDAHHHLWNSGGRRYLFEEAMEDMQSGHNVVGTVYVQCGAMYRPSGPEEFRPVGETEFVAGIAAQSECAEYGPTNLCAAIVGHVDFAFGSRVEPVLDAHIAAGGGRFRGIRGRTAWHESSDIQQLPTPPGVMSKPETRAAIAAIEDKGLTLDLWAFHTQIDEMLDLCRAFPDLTIIINHIGGPIGIGPFRGKRQEVFPVWKEGLRKLAELPNTLVKIGGLGMRFTGFDFHLLDKAPSSDQLVALWKPYVDETIDTFGPKRCIYESNFPVDKAMCSHSVMWNAYKKLLAGFSKNERVAMLAGNAARTYRIKPLLRGLSY